MLAKVATLEIVNELQRRILCDAKPERRLIITGKPGSGKGTQAPIVRDEACLCHLSTGDIFRAAVKNKTPIGKQVEAVMKSGKLVSDEICLQVVVEAMASPECAKGFILDGYPRTAGQAASLDAYLAKEGKAVDAVINLAVDDEILVKRVTGRVVHPASGRSYNIFFNPPKKEMVDDLTGEPLVHRADDTEEALRVRLGEFHLKTESMMHHYASIGKVKNIDADKPIAVVTQAVRAALSSK